ncbi:HlyD family efflux transporter periplasmic adaptor subunit [Roseomonas eburnea]|uniref:HlyD family efflux transporter periplasmic adaptor subunit n=1 Tax=Neoroseomonas eburnea TaxID=1346889 RepID=A0A9X9XIG9_9PROT|nr:efflux RND transporter periplasmic adaptor subunit [Neoroseomonas eburnea]MBR0683505.1 HlyD family efflux transporter periplasmic adaptor subunit [Neoroseomonas eburnea]
MTRRGRLLLGLAVLAAAGAGYAWVSHGEAERMPAPAAASAAGPVGVGALGRVEPASRIRRLNQPGGMAVTRLDRLLVAEGDQVEEGALLAEFADAAQKDAAVAQAEAAVAEARASLDRMRAAGRPSEVEAQRARIEALVAQQNFAARDAERAERLVPTGAGAIAAADRNRAAALRLAAERRQAEAELDSLLSSRPEDIALAEARLAAAEAALAKARADAELSRVRAPFGGTILRIIARPGDQVGGDGLLEIGDLSRMDIVADVYETDLPRLRMGAPAEVVVPGESRRFAATVREIGWTVRRQTQANTDPVAAVDSRTVEVRLALDDAGSEALRRRSNMQVQVAIRP